MLLYAGNKSEHIERTKMNNAWILCVGTALCWAAAPLIGRASGLGVWALATLLSLGTFLSAVPYGFTQNYQLASKYAIAMGLGAGIVNGIGVFLFYRLIAGANQKLWDMSAVAATTYVLIPVLLVLGARLWFSDAFTMNKMIGFAFAVLAIWFLNR